MQSRKLKDLVSVGPATIKDFDLLGIHSVEHLINKDARKLYLKLCKITGVRHDPCCEDVFAAAIAQACNSELPMQKCQWWYWSRIRKERKVI